MRYQPDAALTTGQAAAMCDVSPHTVSNWIDADPPLLAGRRLPGSRARRVDARVLYRFLVRHGMPVKDEMKDVEEAVLAEQP